MPEVRRRRSPGLRRLGRRARRLWRDRPRVVVAGGIGFVVLLGLVWALWSMWSVARHLGEVEDQAEIMRAAMERGDVDGARRAMEAYQEAADAAVGDTDGPTWWVFERTPMFGDDARGIAVVAEVLQTIGDDGLPPVAEAASQITADTFQPKNGVFPVERIRSMEEPALRSEETFARAASRLDKIDSSGFIGLVADRFDTLETLVDEGRNTLDSTYRASRLMPVLLGDEKPRYFLMVLQNNAEIRSSGGLPGALSLVRAVNGRVDIVEQADMSDIGETTADFVPRLTAEEQRLFGTSLGGVAVNPTLTPDIPRSADLIRQRWRRATGLPIDGMIFVDPVAVSYLLSGTGAVPVPGYAPVDQTNVVSEVENAIYLRTADRQKQSDYQQAVAKAVFNAFAAGRGDSVAAVRGLVTAVTEGRIRMHFFDAESQGEVAGTEIAGEVNAEPSPIPTVGVYLNDAGPTKMQYYLDYEASLVARSCGGGQQRLAGSVQLKNNGKSDLPPSITGEGYPGVRVAPGEQLLVVYLTSPVGGEITSVSIDGQQVVDPVIQQFAGRSVAPIAVELGIGGRQSIEFEVDSGPEQRSDPELVVTPGAFPSSSNVTIDSACRVN